MDPLGINIFDENSRATDTPSLGQELSNVMSGNDSLGDDIFQKDNISSSEPDIDHGLTSAKEHDPFYSSEESLDSCLSPAKRCRSLEKSSPGVLQISAVDNTSTGDSLFDDLLDFSPVKTQEASSDFQDAVTEPKLVSNLDLLLEVDSGQVSVSDMVPEAKAKNPDLLDFIDMPFDLPEVSPIDTEEVLVSEPLSNDWTLVSELPLPPLKVEKEQSPDILITFPSSEVPDDKTCIKKQADERLNENINENLSEKLDIEDVLDKTDNRASTGSEDLDFSVLQLPGVSALNFDHSKHRRTLSQKGSIASRRKPKRAIIQPSSEDNIFIDSTEPRPPKLESEDNPDSQNHAFTRDNAGENDKAKGDVDGEMSKEASPSRKPVIGIKIPGLLEGLSKSKAFNKMERKSPEKESDESSVIASQVSLSELAYPPVTSSNVLTTVKESPPAIRPKPVILPRVLPKPDAKFLDQTQNQSSSSSESLLRASSFKNTKSAPALPGQQPSFLKSSTALSRSASVKVAGVLANRDQESSLQKESKTDSIVVSGLLQTKLEARKPAVPIASKPAAGRNPPLVPAKPSIAAKPRAVSEISASFSGGRSPLLPQIKTEKTVERNNAGEQKPNSNVPLSVNTKPESVCNTDVKPAFGAEQSIDTKPFMISAVRNPLTSVEKAVDAPSSSGQKSMDGQPSFSLKGMNMQSPSAKSGETDPDSGESNEKNSATNKDPAKYLVNSASVLNENNTVLATKKAESFEPDDVFGVGGDITTKPLENCVLDSKGQGNEDTTGIFGSVSPRKLSFTGITSVRSPSITDKNPFAALPRKNSITGSAYNPIGFRSTLGSSDNEQKSRASSFSSCGDGLTDSIQVSGTLPVAEPGRNSLDDSEGQRSRDESFSNATCVQMRKSPNVPSQIELDKNDDNPKPLPERQITLSSTPKGDKIKEKEVADERSQDTQLQSRPFRRSMPPPATNGSPASNKDELPGSKKSSPWNVQLKKIEKDLPAKSETSIKKEDPQPINWRQQLTSKNRNSVPANADAEKPKADNTPEWAKASIKRRQRLIDAGVIRGDSQKASDVF